MKTFLPCATRKVSGFSVLHAVCKEEKKTLSMMKTLFLLFCCAALSSGAFAQTVNQQKQLEDTRKLLATTDYVYPYIDTPPAYAGGSEKWQAYQNTSPLLKDAVKAAKDQKMPAGKYQVTAKFSITADGSVTEVKTTNKPIGYGLEDAVINFIKGSGKWIPANVEGENTKAAVMLPVTFNIFY